MELLEEIILPSFLSYYPRPSLSPLFDLHNFFFSVSCALEREGMDSRLLIPQLTCNNVCVEGGGGGGGVHRSTKTAKDTYI